MRISDWSSVVCSSDLQQRPELWNLYNARKAKGESIRVFPISNWTELDIWQYIACEQIPIVPLYFAAPRPTVERDGLLLMVDDDRFPLRPGEVPVERSIRSEEHTSELQSLMRISYAVFCLKKKNTPTK